MTRRNTFTDETRDDKFLIDSMQRHTRVSANQRAASRSSQAWQKVDELNEESAALFEENKVLRQQLERSVALNRLALIHSKGLVQTIRHLKTSWNPENPEEKGLKDDINPLVNKYIDAAEKDPAALAEVNGKIEKKINPARTPRKHGR